MLKEVKYTPKNQLRFERKTATSKAGFQHVEKLHLNR
jgi:hypothetical protein